jgi:hypothetical protein
MTTKKVEISEEALTALKIALEKLSALPVTQAPTPEAVHAEQAQLAPVLLTNALIDQIRRADKTQPAIPFPLDMKSMLALLDRAINLMATTENITYSAAVLKFAREYPCFIPYLAHENNPRTNSLVR